MKITNLKFIEKINLPTHFGLFEMYVFENISTGKFSTALVIGKIRGRENVLVRIHSSCLTGDVFGSLLCDCGPQLKKALQKIITKRQGVLIYLDQEGRGIGLGNKTKAMKLQEEGLDTVDANLALGLPIDVREFSEAAQIINFLNISSIHLLTNNPEKIKQLKLAGIKIVSGIRCIAKTRSITSKYLTVKKERMGHLLPD